ncbi:MAG: hypothetical protein LBG27_00395 [Spirochaetaceae bacterium]|jgi:hypothetical protein|nr:hypothetical protein [Spirochaetaceae bacterium]
MPMPENLVGKAVPISKQPNRGKGAGRKPKLIRKWIKDCNVSKDDARQMMSHLLHACTLKGLNQLQKTEYDSVSAATYAMISGMVKAAKKGDIKPLIEMYEFIFGKEEQRISLTAHSAEYVELKDAVLENIIKNGEKNGGRETLIEELEKAAGCETDEG